MVGSLEPIKEGSLEPITEGFDISLSKPINFAAGYIDNRSGSG